MATNPALLKSARLFHLYSGVFFAPALIFFAFTGAIQTFSLHETTRGSNYKPPAILAKLGQLHKKQTLIIPVRNPPPPETAPHQTPASAAKQANPKPAGNPADARAAAPKDPQAPTPPKAKNLWPMKYFFALTAWGLFLSTLSGIYMAYKYTRRSLNITLTLLAGIAVPLLLLLF